MVAEMGVLVCGSTNVDRVWVVRQFPKFHEKVRAEAVKERVGGSGALTAIELAKHTSVGLVSEVGVDRYGEECIQYLADLGIDTSYLKKEGRTKQALVILAGADKRIVTSPRASLDRAVAQELLEYSDAFACLHVAEENNPLNVEIAKHMSSQGKPVFLEMKSNKNDLLLPLVTGVFLNAEEFRSLTGFELGEHPVSIAELLGVQPGAFVVVTNSGNSIFLSHQGRDKALTIASLSGRIENRNGAGDTFNGGFIRAYLEGNSLEECVLLGQQAAAARLKSAI